MSGVVTRFQNRAKNINESEKKIGQFSKAMEGFCFVTGLERTNNRKDDGEKFKYCVFLSSVYSFALEN
jgi:hypothetical protein